MELKPDMDTVSIYEIADRRTSGYAWPLLTPISDILDLERDMTNVIPF